MSRIMTLRGRCRQCDCAVELGFIPWTGSGPATAPEWACPECHRGNLLPAIGEVTRVDRAASARAPVGEAPPAQTH